jgi:2-polyprenyl-3-methyl-5-hydroxy-6-metoxy-1,4-benzoquinol methylase
MERFGAGWDLALEHSAFLGLLPDVRGLRVLDLGCGAGQLTHHLAQSGASEVIGIDVSKRMLVLAAAERAHPCVTYRRESIEQANFSPASLDLAVSSLAFHYVQDYRGLVSRIASWLAPGGRLVYSAEHPSTLAVYQTTAGCWTTRAGEWGGPSTTTLTRDHETSTGSWKVCRNITARCPRC